MTVAQFFPPRSSRMAVMNDCQATLSPRNREDGTLATKRESDTAQKPLCQRAASKADSSRSSPRTLCVTSAIGEAVVFPPTARLPHFLRQLRGRQNRRRGKAPKVGPEAQGLVYLEKGLGRIIPFRGKGKENFPFFFFQKIRRSTSNIFLKKGLTLFIEKSVIIRTIRKELRI